MKMRLCILVMALSIVMIGCEQENNTVMAPIVTNDNIEAFQESNPLKHDKRENDSLIYVELEDWNHETKKVFADEPLFDKLVMVELTENQKYPIFHVAINKDHLNNYLEESVFMRIVGEIAKANGYWNYEIKDSVNKISIKVYTDREKQEVVEAAINGASTLDSYLTNVSGSFEAIFDTMTMDDVVEKAIAFGDLNQDGENEYIIKHQDGFKGVDEYYVIRKQEEKPIKVGQITDELMTKYGASNVRIVPLKEDEKPRIIVDLGGLEEARIGYLIFELENNLPVSIDQGYLTDIARGYMYIDDLDGDNSYEKITVRDLDTIEPLRASDIRPFYKESYKILERTKNFSSNHITKPEAFVRSFAELLSLRSMGYETGTLIREYVVSDFILSSSKEDLSTTSVINSNPQILVEAVNDSNLYRVYNAWENHEIEVEIELFNGELKVKNYTINRIK